MTLATYTAVQALTRAAAEHNHRSQDWTGFCLKFVRTMVGIPAHYDDADSAWDGAVRRHAEYGSTPPAGAAIFYRGGQHGHVTLSAGGGMCWSTDLIRRGQVDKVPVNAPEAKWGYRYLGWTEDLNGHGLRLPVPTPPANPAGPHWINYTIKPGDTLVSIGKRIKASVSTLYSHNATLLELVAREHGKPSSVHGTHLYAGTVIQVPSGFPGQR